MAIFISYSSQDRTSLDALTTALKRAQQKVWFDQELGGGDAWWNAILEQIRSCDVFIVALSNNWLQSKPSQAELRYAQALNRPILPVQVGPVDSVRVNPVSALQIIDYQNPTVDAGIQLVTAIHGLSGKESPLPSPLPEEPPLPFGYIMRLGNTLSEKELTPQQQLQLLVELRSGLDEDGSDPSARSDIAQLLRMLRMRHDVTYRTRTEIDNVLAEIEAKDGSPAGPKPPAPGAAEAAPPPAATSAAPTQPAIAATPARPATGSAGATASSAGGSNKRLLLIGGAALAAVVVLALIVVFATQGGGRKPAAKPGTSSAALAAPAGASGQNSDKLDSFLLNAAEIGTIIGDPNMTVTGKTDLLRATPGTLSSPECFGAYEPLLRETYEGADGFVGARGQAIQTPGEDPQHRTYEAVAAFGSAEKAHAFVQASADKWRACAERAVTLTTPKRSFDWTFGRLEGEPRNRIWMEKVAAAGGRSCHHVLSAQIDVVVDVLACGAAAAASPAGKVVDQIAAKIEH
ncbi:sensor domain-containing protein [Mycobacterium vicinigordonae]|uniref:Sensor domain-containing protein n=1 Tax=Mycobacterium vicinigordonae TaxID=1719132 RepID=A0A7D6HP73_9MYCO|nr:sensor domain-containing protein [Mycobacterium vicinigordonae]QLL06891.1 sensor domain-containing protein [Mycobacterium vicinigordonae]